MLGIVTEDVVDDDRLGTSNEHDRFGICATSVPIAARQTGGVVLQDAVRQSQLRLMNLDRIELIEMAFDGDPAAGIGDQHAIQTRVCSRTEEQATPLSGS